MSAAPRACACKRAALAASFFEDARRADADADRRAHVDRVLLARALLLASQNRWVADWLFSDADAAFHTNLPVPLSAFDSAHPMSIMHLFQSSGCTRRLASNMLIVPIASINSLSVGYTVSKASNSHRKVGRYVFHSKSSEMLVVVNYYSPAITAVMSVMPYPHTIKHFLFTCPVGHYSFHNLPNHVFSTHIAESEPPPTPAVPQIAHQTPTVPNSIDHFLELAAPDEPALPPTDSSTLLSLLDLDTPSHLPWIVDHTSSLSDNIGIPATPGTAETSSGAFNLSALSETLHNIEQTLQGRFLGTSDHHYPLEMTFTAPVEQTIVNITTATALEANLLRRYAVNVYFDATTPVLTDEKFLSVPTTLHDAVSPAIVTQAQQAVSCVTQRTRRIAPCPASVTSDTKALSKTEADLARERMLEARRRRNRLSAARSNEKRKQAWKRNVQALEELKQRVQQLQSKHERLVRENGVLRREVGYEEVAGGEHQALN